MRNFSHLFMVILLLLLNGCSVLGYQSERKSNWQSGDNSDATPSVRSALSKKSASLTNSPMLTGTEIDYLLVKKMIALAKSEPKPVEFKDVEECEKNRIKVCSALKGCSCEVDRATNK